MKKRRRRGDEREREIEEAEGRGAESRWTFDNGRIREDNE